jgi:hypothetical protein
MFGGTEFSLIENNNTTSGKTTASSKVANNFSDEGVSNAKNIDIIDVSYQEYNKPLNSPDAQHYLSLVDMRTCNVGIIFNSYELEKMQDQKDYQKLSDIVELIRIDELSNIIDRHADTLVYLILNDFQNEHIVTLLDYRDILPDIERKKYLPILNSTLGGGSNVISKEISCKNHPVFKELFATYMDTFYLNK